MEHGTRRKNAAKCFISAGRRSVHSPCSIIISHDERYSKWVRLPALARGRMIFYLSHVGLILHEEARQIFGLTQKTKVLKRIPTAL